ncbi:choice-of-anchor L domain-containing protein [Flavobacterium silvaticum]|uniref:T9SS type A sorting domain-containing protein n=1 Tax=Flavobacterium silvaticum TaxID=1852020 RepID=A0A972JEQ5_9FLAO|nr:choice-of-anchor L domain-containing protein [Flavobacterium silvaticum]NMH27149.1 T9SS type A sorting domain-containing protein [Flavobacterium silvaticum]
MKKITLLLVLTAFQTLAVIAANSKEDTHFALTLLCPEPTNVSALLLPDGTNAQISWQENGSATQWYIEVIVTDALGNTNISTYSSTQTDFTVSNVAPNSNVSVRVKSVCMPAEESDWSAPVTFNTPATPSSNFISTNTTTFTPQQLVSDILINNPCFVTSNVTANGFSPNANSSIGYFTNAGSNFDMTSGIIISTGKVTTATGPNTTEQWNSSGLGSDPDLDELASNSGAMQSLHDAATLSFDFVSQSDSFSFNFIFASEEYGTYQCNYGDIFGFFLKDLTTADPTVNLAVVPGTMTPVSVLTIRNSDNNPGCPSSNPDFFGSYTANASPEGQLSATNFNGLTTKMTASSSVIPGHVYRIKLAIADYGDTIMDSAVFIEEGSFQSGLPECNDRIKIQAFVDTNSNGSKEEDEPYFNQGSFSVEQNNSGIVDQVYAPTGTYTLYESNPSNTYDFGYVMNPSVAGYYTATPVLFNDVNIVSGSGTTTLLYPITPVSNVTDFGIFMTSPFSPAKPALEYTKLITVTNFGQTTASGTVTFTKDALTTLTDLPFGTQTATGFTYTVSDLAPLASIQIPVGLLVADVPAVDMGDVLSATASISVSGDNTLANDTFTGNDVVVNSFDPNSIEETHGPEIPIAGFVQESYLYYTIHFQNLGTAHANKVRVESILDGKLDSSSIELIGSSHNFELIRNGASLTFIFNPIYLPGVFESEDASKGYVTYRIRTKPGIEANDIIPANAAIYFDTNAAIDTNTWNTEFTVDLSVADSQNSTVKIYPNPAKSVVNVNIGNNQIDEVSIYDIVGKKVLQLQNSASDNFTIDVSKLSVGLYMIELSNQGKKISSQKLIIQ